MYKRFFLFLILIAFISGCHFAANKEKMEEYASPAPATGAMSLRKTAVSEYAEAEDTVGGNLAAERKVIYTAEINLEVKSYDESKEAINSIVKKAGGFIADSSLNVSGNSTKSGTIKIRIPSDKFQSVLQGLKGVGTVKYEAEHGNDVTEEYADIEVRLANAKVMEARLLDLMQTKTNKVKDLLEVERELGRVRENIERMEGRKRFMDDRLSFSTITINLYEPHVYTTSVFDPVKDAFSKAGGLLMASIGGLITFLAIVIPWLIIVIVFVWIVIKLFKRRKRKKEDKTEKTDKA